ncbi:peptidoglycan-binding protein [Chachezhania antarctica]|uniref:peptidoglycan-binding protein n=1 Tax=Chachezhania antarctica TaxID=2340860 RepID=UPI000EB320E1|nr:peptidoglycan-binding protein [Chachezhania antarctica]|tara:strand:+ start:3029 stop:3817 length:789 start_codon:yes stop_codon:yes gene_type:complete
MIPLDADFIYDIAPGFSGRYLISQRRIVSAIADDLSTVLESYEINSFLRIAHFMAQVTHECAGFRTTEEFATGAAYEGRADLGNTEPGDGRRYKGRGLIQLTGRYNYRKYGAMMGLDLENTPEIAAEPLTSLKIACTYWADHDLNALADRDYLVTITRRINGGTNGLADRGKYLTRAKTALRKRQAIILSHAQGGTGPVLRRGSFGAEVERLQTLLHEAGWPIAVDGDFGPATELAVMRFQATEGLVIDGIVGRNTWAAFGG